MTPCSHGAGELDDRADVDRAGSPRLSLTSAGIPWPGRGDRVNLYPAPEGRTRRPARRIDWNAEVPQLSCDRGRRHHGNGEPFRLFMSLPGSAGHARRLPRP